MDCIGEWDSQLRRTEGQWLMQFGHDLVQALPLQRGIMMRLFVDKLMKDQYVQDIIEGWTLAAEVYGSALAIHEIDKAIQALERRA